MANALAGVWIFTITSVAIMILRLILGRKCKVKWDIGDSLTVAAIVFSAARISLVHVTILWKTNRITEEYRDTHLFTGRVLYIWILWIQKCVLLAFYQKLVKGMSWGRTALLLYIGIFMITFSGSMVVSFVECRPINKYWRLFPDPGNCPRATINLIVVGSFNVFTDLALIGLPIPILLQVQLSLQKKIQLGFLFCAGFLIVAVTAARIPFTLHLPNSQTSRSVWTTGECLASAFAANVPSLYSSKQRLKRRAGNVGSDEISPVRRIQELNVLDSTGLGISRADEVKILKGKQAPTGSNNADSGVSASIA